MASIARGALVAVVASGALAGCATCPLKTASTAAQPYRVKAAAVEESNDDETRKWCGQRHIDYQDGKSPGGAKSLQQKFADDRICAALEQQN
ncbi:MAG TPA: hypothetical protein VJ045_07995 [Hyphomicrobiaceae bacterium]|nr:hypothetical protein [Hyphomicrobiaceae bacterium]